MKFRISWIYSPVVGDNKPYNRIFDDFRDAVVFVMDNRTNWKKWSFYSYSD